MTKPQGKDTASTIKKPSKILAEKNSIPTLSAIDLFAGIGGIRLGFEAAFKDSLNTVFSSEIDKFACKTYEGNFGHTPNGDITQIDAKDIPRHDILLAGFPCQAFSVAGLRRGFEDTRGTLFFEVARIIKHHRPKVVFLENVKGLLCHDKGKTFEVIINTLKELGYNISYKLLNAKNFGLPQNRERIYIVGFLKSAFDGKSFDFDKVKAYEGLVRVGNILEAEVAEKYTISDKLWAGHKARKLRHIKNGNGFGYCIFNEASPYTSTISARYYKDGQEILIEQAGKNPRKLSPREALNLQGFKASYKQIVSDTQTYKQVGNSVSVPVVEAIARAINEAMNKYHHI